MQTSSIPDTVSSAYNSFVPTRTYSSEINSIQQETIDISYQNGDYSVQLSLNQSIEYNESMYTAEGLLPQTETNFLQPSNELETSQSETVQNLYEQYLNLIRRKVEYLLNQLIKNSEQYGSQQSQDTGGVVDGNSSYTESTIMLSRTVSIDGEITISDYYSPEQTAERIVNFALSFYSGGDRNEFAEMVKEAVMKGYQQALEAMGGSLPSVAQKTISLVMNALDSFAAGEPLNISA